MINGSVVLTWIVIDVIIVDINLLIFVIYQEKLVCHFPFSISKWDHRLCADGLTVVFGFIVVTIATKVEPLLG